MHKGVRLLTEGDRTLFDIRTGYIDLQHCHVILITELFHHFDIILNAFSTDIDDHLCIIIL